MRAILIMGVIVAGVVYIISNLPSASDRVERNETAQRAEPPLPGYTSYVGNRLLRVVILDDSSAVSTQDFTSIGSKVCQYENICQAAFWSSRASAPPAYFGEMTNAQLAAKLAQYQKNSNTGLSRTLLNCTRFPDTPGDKCL